MPFFVGAVVYWMLSTTSGFTALVSIIILSILQVLFEIWTYVPGQNNDGVAITFFITWGVLYALAKIGSKIQ